MSTQAQSTEIRSIDPATGSVLRSFVTLANEALDTRIATAAVAFGQYRETSLQQRALWMRKLAGIFDHEMEELANLITQETGKTITAAREEILSCAACCRYFADHSECSLAPEPFDMDGSAGAYRYDPMGVILTVLTWSTPLWQLLRFLVPALMAGNVVLLKPASSVPQCAVELETLLRRAGFPGGCLQTLLIPTWQVESVLSDQRVSAVLITGSEPAHRALAAQAGWLAKKSFLQHGASGVFIVLPSSNLFAAIQAGVRSRCLDNGQSSLSAASFLVHESIYEDFELLFTAAMEDIKVGNPLKDETELGPLASEEALKTLEDQISIATRAGGRILTGGQRLMGRGNFFEPTVLVDVPARARICREPLLGPVALLFRIDSLAQAITLANESVYETDVSVWTTEPEEQKEATAELVCGSVFLNMAAGSDLRLSAARSNRSSDSFGLSLGSVRAFVNARAVVTHDTTQEAEMIFDLSPEDRLIEDALAAHLQESQEPQHQQGDFTAQEEEELLDFKHLLEQSMQLSEEGTAPDLPQETPEILIGTTPREVAEAQQETTQPLQTSSDPFHVQRPAQSRCPVLHEAAAYLWREARSLDASDEEFERPSRLIVAVQLSCADNSSHRSCNRSPASPHCWNTSSLASSRGHTTAKKITASRPGAPCHSSRKKDR